MTHILSCIPSAVLASPPANVVVMTPMCHAVLRLRPLRLMGAGGAVNYRVTLCTAAVPYYIIDDT